MRYLITHPDHKPFYCDKFEYYAKLVSGSTVFDLETRKHTTNGHTWEDTIIDSL
jgi:hypothetical protein